jgi:hypothetical protein
MRHLGHSGAVIQAVARGVRKRAEGILHQAIYVMALGRGVCPEVRAWSTDGDWYDMERLSEVRVPVDSTEMLQLLDRARSLLAGAVWSQQPFYSDFGWYVRLHRWCDLNAPWLVAELDELYAGPPARSVCRIHGDPTLANVMRRGLDLVLIDPIPPGGKVPALREVDVGKLLQSAIGWEHQLDADWPPGAQEFVDQVLRYESDEMRRKSHFWLAVHCARILPYAKSPRIARWAEEQSLRALHVRP